MVRALSLVSSTLATLAMLATVGCEEQEPLTIEVDVDELEADGVAQARITVHTLDVISGGTVQITATRGALASSTVALNGQEANVVLWAPLERELGRSEAQPIDITARVTVSKSEAIEATARIRAVAPKDGPPLLFLDAEPPAAVLGDEDTITLRVVARRIADGAQLALTTDAGELEAASVTVQDGVAAGSLRAPASAADAIVTVRDEASGIEARTAVRWVNDGEPLFDLTGTFVQIGPARVKLASEALTPSPQCVLAPSLVRVEFVQTGSQLEAHYTTCAVTFPPVTSIVGTVENFAEQSFYDAIPVVDAEFALGGTELGARYHPPASTVVVGAELDDPADDALPEDEGDERVVDADGDGAPGVTVVNSLGGEQHIVYRNIGESQGKVRSSTTIIGDEIGDLRAKTETSVFGIGGGFLPDTIPLGSVVEVQRIDGQFASFDADANGDGAISCQEAIDAAPVVTVLSPPDTPFDCAGVSE